MTSSGDLDFSTGNLSIVRDVAHVTAQKLTALYSIAKGEWFADGRLGVPYVTQVYLKNPSLTSISSMLVNIAQKCPGVAAVAAIKLNYNPSARQLGAVLTVITNDGATLTGGLGQPFIVTRQPA
jgi:hypothetical protein